jgi:nitrite reductase/ring-hydroxylating ferredoxin subunit
MAGHEVTLGALSDMADGEHRVFAIDTVEVGVFRIGDRLFAYENTCPHAGGPVCQGKIFNRVEELLTSEKKSLGLRFSTRRNIVCPWHGYEFDIETGVHPGNRAVRLKPVKVDVREGQIFVSLAT